MDRQLFGTDLWRYFRDKRDCDFRENSPWRCYDRVPLRRATGGPSFFLLYAPTGSVISSGASWNCCNGKKIHTETRYVSLSFITQVNFEFWDWLKSPIHFFIIQSRVTSSKLGPPVVERGAQPTPEMSATRLMTHFRKLLKNKPGLGEWKLHIKKEILSLKGIYNLCGIERLKKWTRQDKLVVSVVFF